ncbi:unnamed protein product [Protopolystoma xenopodis]|uniref:Dynein regulatory complex subunit 4 n=1 Tax=Protopolystoma xenopodis TaxID=117903 RepID=A0A448WI49_9PLAT|nr:unnamed protein product [Protopolystoma xenopodis]
MRLVILFFKQIEAERDELYEKFVSSIHQVQAKTGLKNLLLERRLIAMTESMEKKEVQLSEVLSASNLDPGAMAIVTRKVEVITELLINESVYSDQSANQLFEGLATQ